MSCTLRYVTMAAFTVALVGWAGSSWGQPPAGADEPAAANPAPGLAVGAPPAAANPPTTAHRRLAPWVMQGVDPQREVEESFSRHDMVELLAFDPGFDWAEDVTFRRDIWNLEFKFKPVRMIEVDLPQADGRMQRKLIWYLLYSVTNHGKVLHPVEDQDGTFKIVQVDKPVRFVPEFLMEAPEFGKFYPDRVIPLALGPIRLREDRTQTIYNSIDMTREIPVGQTVWGVATWESIDPQIDQFSIYVYGLTNAYRWKDEAGAYKWGESVGKGRTLSRKALKLNFWRPGDEYYENEKEIRYGAPGDVDYEWVYR